MALVASGVWIERDDGREIRTGVVLGRDFEELHVLAETPFRAVLAASVVLAAAVVFDSLFSELGVALSTQTACCTDALRTAKKCAS